MASVDTPKGHIHVTKLVVARLRAIIDKVQKMEDACATTHQISDATGIPQGTISDLVPVLVGLGALEVTRAAPRRGFMFALTAAAQGQGDAFPLPEPGAYVLRPILSGPGEAVSAEGPAPPRGAPVQEEGAGHRSLKQARQAGRRVLSHFLEAPDAGHTRNEISDNGNMALGSVDIGLKYLLDMGLIAVTGGQMALSGKRQFPRRIYTLTEKGKQVGPEYLATGELDES